MIIESSCINWTFGVIGFKVDRDNLFELCAFSSIVNFN
jgi:hypothetical protein